MATNRQVGREASNHIQTGKQTSRQAVSQGTRLLTVAKQKASRGANRQARQQRSDRNSRFVCSKGNRQEDIDTVVNKSKVEKTGKQMEDM